MKLFRVVGVLVIIFYMLASYIVGIVWADFLLHFPGRQDITHIFLRSNSETKQTLIGMTGNSYIPICLDL